MRLVDIYGVLVSDEAAAVVPVVVSIRGDGEGLRALSVAVDDVEIVYVEVVRRDAKGCGEIVAARCGGRKGVGDDDLVLGVVLVLGRVAVYDDLPADLGDNDLTGVGSRVDEDRGGGGGTRWDGVDRCLKLR